MVGEPHGSPRIASLRMNEGQRVVAEREIRTEVDRLLQFDERLILMAAQPQGPAHGPVRAGIAVVGHQALTGGIEGTLDLRLAPGPSLKSVLEMGEGQTAICPREGGIEMHCGLEKLLRALVVGLVESIHVPQAAVIGLPGIQRAGRLQHRAVALDHLDFVRDGRNDHVADFAEHKKCIIRLLVEDLRPHHPGGAGLGEFDGHGETIAPTLQRSADNVIHIEHAAGFLRPHMPLAQGEDRALCNDKETSQLCESRNEVMSETARRPARGYRRLGGPFDKRHDGDGGSAR